MEYLARLFYIGDQFHGSQAQPGLRTVQGELIHAIQQWSGEEHSTATVRLSGRTDRGVHSIGQIVSITTGSSFDINGINKRLPRDICLWAHTRAPDGFDPRRDVLMRHYRYVLTEGEETNIGLMREAAQIIAGFHDFVCLSKRDGDRPTVTTLLNIAISQHDDVTVVDAFGSSFLWKLVRKIVTLLYWVGIASSSLENVRAILEQGQCPSGGIRPAPPEALFLVEVIVPFQLIPNKYALKRVRKTLASKLSFLRRSYHAMRAIFASEVMRTGPLSNQANSESLWP